MSKKSMSPSGERTFTFVFYTETLFQRRFLWGDRRPEVFAPSSLRVWNQIPQRNLQIRVLPRGFLREHLKFDGV